MPRQAAVRVQAGYCPSRSRRRARTRRTARPPSTRSRSRARNYRIARSSTTPLSRQFTISSAIENFCCGFGAPPARLLRWKPRSAAPAAMPGVAAAGRRGAGHGGGGRWRQSRPRRDRRLRLVCYLGGRGRQGWRTNLGATTGVFIVSGIALEVESAGGDGRIASG